MENTVRNCRKTFDEIKDLSKKFPNESRFIIETILQRNAVPVYEVQALLHGEGERDRFVLIMNTLQEIKRGLLELNGNKVYDDVQSTYDPLAMPVTLVNRPNVEHGAYPKGKLIPTKRDLAEKKKAISTPGFWR